MAKTSSRRTRPAHASSAPAPQAPPPPAPIGAPASAEWGLVAIKVAATVFLVLLAIALFRQSGAELRKERLAWDAEMLKRRDSTSPQRVTILREALSHAPHDPILQRELATALLQNESPKLSRGLPITVGNLQEGLKLLEEARHTFPQQAILLRTRGEVAMILAQAARRSGDTQKAEEYQRIAFREYTASEHQLPVPRIRGPELRADLIRSAILAGNQVRSDLPPQNYAAVIETYRDMRTDGQAWAVESFNLEMPFVQSHLALGLHPVVLRLAREGLARNPQNQPLQAVVRTLEKDPTLAPPVPEETE